MNVSLAGHHGQHSLVMTNKICADTSHSTRPGDPHGRWLGLPSFLPSFLSLYLPFFFFFFCQMRVKYLLSDNAFSLFFCNDYLGKECFQGGKSDTLTRFPKLDRMFMNRALPLGFFYQ